MSPFENLTSSSLRVRSGIYPEVLCLGVVFLLDFCNLVFNKTLMLSLCEGKIHIHYVSYWPVFFWQLPGSRGGFFSDCNLSLQSHSPAVGLASACIAHQRGTVFLQYSNFLYVKAFLHAKQYI